MTEFIGSSLSKKQPEVEKISWSRDTVWVDKGQTTGFRGVREPVWNFHIGGYQVCEKWLKDRKGRTLTSDDIAHYQKIVVALSETIRLMVEIDEVIAKHGGWPGAFIRLLKDTVGVGVGVIPHRYLKWSGAAELKGETIAIAGLMPVFEHLLRLNQDEYERSERKWPKGWADFFKLEARDKRYFLVVNKFIESPSDARYIDVCLQTILHKIFLPNGIKLEGVFYWGSIGEMDDVEFGKVVLKGDDVVTHDGEVKYLFTGSVNKWWV